MEKEDNKKVLEFYNSVSENGRLERGLGIIEFYRTKQILNKYINNDSNIIYDIGGGTGIYSNWLACKNNEVHLLDLSPNAIEYAKLTYTNFISEVCDARSIDRSDESADIVLLMGPLYHLQNLEDRLKVLNECYRVLKKDGLLFSVGISKFSTTTWALSTYGTKNNLLDEIPFTMMIEKELKEGIHNRPAKYPYLLTQAYFHTPLQLQKEIETLGFETLNKHAIEGTIWFTPDLNKKWDDINTRKKLLNILEITEHELEIMGMSPHFMIVSKK